MFLLRVNKGLLSCQMFLLGYNKYTFPKIYGRNKKIIVKTCF